eukprot:1785070-Prorocentrum_lima.AAC.1
MGKLRKLHSCRIPHPPPDPMPQGRPPADVIVLGSQLSSIREPGGSPCRGVLVVAEVSAFV